MNTSIIRVIVVWAAITIGGYQLAKDATEYCSMVVSYDMEYYSRGTTESDQIFYVNYYVDTSSGTYHCYVECGPKFMNAVQIGRNVISRVVNMKAVE